MVATQGGAMILALVLAALVYGGVVNIWLVLVIATLRGALASVNLPARHSLISDLVPREHLANAIALNSLTRNIMKVVGPALAGILIGLLGTAACFAINAATFVAVLVSLLMMDVTTEVHAANTTSIAASLLEGFNFVWRHETIGVLVLIALVPTFFGQNYLSMLTLFARDVFQWGPEGLGLLTSCAALGSVLGALALATVPRLARSGQMMLIFLIVFGVCLVGFALTPWVAVAPVLLLGAGAMQIAYNATNNTILQMTVPDQMRGRVLSTLLLNKGLASLGTATAATLAAFMGERWALAAMAAAIVLLGTLVYAKAVPIRRLDV
jgi:MFS family permease